MVSTTWSLRCSSPVTLLRQRRSIAGSSLHPIDQIGLGIELLQVDEGGPLVPFLRQQIELIKQRRAVKNPADAPHHALVDHALADAEPVPEFERALGKADRARALADPVGVVEQHHGLAALRQIDRERQPDRAGADHDHGIFGDLGVGPILIGDGGDSRTGLWTAAPCVHAALAKDLIAKDLIGPGSARALGSGQAARSGLR